LMNERSISLKYCGGFAQITVILPRANALHVRLALHVTLFCNVRTQNAKFMQLRQQLL
jgi:hypothetical protein